MINKPIDELRNLRKALLPLRTYDSLKKVNCPTMFKCRLCCTSIFRFNNTF